jgi:hypothetical protein
MTNLSADSGTEHMASVLSQAAGELELIDNANLKLVNDFQSHGWAGLDDLLAGGSTISSVRDKLADVAEKIGVGGQIVRDAHLNNAMITKASRASLSDS